MLVYLILVYIINAASADSDAKYIDLLPEEEKQEFLQRIAKRILEEVEPETRKKGIPDVTKDELNTHNEFIKNILKEEKANLRKDGKKNIEDDFLTEKDNITKNSSIFDKGNLTVKPLARKGKKRKGYIDLTLRSPTTKDGSSEKKDDEQNKGGEASNLSEDIQVKSKTMQVQNDQKDTNPELETTTVDLKVSVTEYNDNITQKIPIDYYLDKTEKSTYKIEEENQSFSQKNGSLNINLNDNTDGKIVEDTTVTTGIITEKQTDFSTQVIETKTINHLNFQGETTVNEKESPKVNIRRNYGNGLPDEGANENTVNKYTDINSKEFVEKKILRTVISETPTDDLVRLSEKNDEVILPIVQTTDNVSYVSNVEKIETIMESTVSTTQIPTVIESIENTMKSDKPSKLTEDKLSDTTVTYTPSVKIEDEDKASEYTVTDITRTDNDDKANTEDSKYKLTNKTEKMSMNTENNSHIETITSSDTTDTKIIKNTNVGTDRNDKLSINKYTKDEAISKTNETSTMIEKNNHPGSGITVDTKYTKIRKDTNIDTKTEKEVYVDTDYTNGNLHSPNTEVTKLEKDNDKNEHENSKIDVNIDEKKSKSHQENKQAQRDIFIDLEALQRSKSYKMTHLKDKIVSASAEHFEKNHETLDGLNEHIYFYGPHMRVTDLENDISELKNENIKGADEDKANELQIKNDNVNEMYEINLENESTTEKIKVLTPKPIDVRNIVDSMELIKYKIKKKDNPSYDTVEKHRDTVKDIKIGANGKLGLKSVKIIPHVVYEIPVNESPFKKVKKELVDLNKEQPNVVPIYNYSPNNAFYNGINNQGPNPNDLKSKLTSANNKNIERTENLRMDYWKSNDDTGREFKIMYSDPNKNVGSSINDIISKYFQKNHEENIERCKNRTKKKEESFKETIREARIFMYEKKYFGNSKKKNITSVSEELLGKAETDENPKDDSLRENNNIAVDYYFPITNEPYDRARDIYKQQRNTLSYIIKRIGQIIGKKIYFVPSLNMQKAPKIIHLKNKEYRKQNNDKKLTPNLEKIKKVLDFTPDIDLIPTMNKLLQMNIQRSGLDLTPDIDLIPTMNKQLQMNVQKSGLEGIDVEIYIDVLSDMVQSNDHSLEVYDWIGTTVDIQGAFAKLIFLADQVLKKRYLNPLDYELLKYAAYLHKQAVKSTKNITNSIRSVLPKAKHIKNNFLTQKGLFVREWLYRENLEDVIKKKDIHEFKQFLKKLQNKLYELHTAVKYIAEITTYHKQHWFKNLKELYLDNSEIKTLELLLHFTTMRVLDSIENSSGKGLEQDYIQYMEKHPTEFENVKGDYVFLLKIVDLMEKNNE